MLNTLLMYGGKKHADLGIGQELDTDSLHHVQPDGSVQVTPSEQAQCIVQRPPRALWSGAFEWRYSISVWLCPHKFVGGSEYVPWLACYQRPTDATWTKVETRHQSAWGIEQMTPLGAPGGHGPQEAMYIGHTDGSNRYGRVYSLQRLHWTHLFITVDASQTNPADRQKVWINGVLTAGNKGAAYWGDLQPSSQKTQWPANPFLNRDYPGGHVSWVPPDSPHAANVTLGIGYPGPFWNHLENSNLANISRPHCGIAAVYFIDDHATVDQIAAHDPITNIWTQHPLVPQFGGASFYINFSDRGGDQVGVNSLIGKDQLGRTNTVTYNARQNVSGNRNTFRGKAEAVVYPNMP